MRFGTKRSLKIGASGGAIKAADVTAEGGFTGYGSVFGVVDDYNEIVAPGAFAESLADLAAKERVVPVLWQHNSDQPIGAYDTIAEDDYGLKVTGRLLIAEVAQAREAHALLKSEAVSGLSIGYRVRESSFDEKTNIRTLTKLDLVEVSIVTFPACDEARIAEVKLKLAHGELPSTREFEESLRDLGFSRSKALAIAGAATPHLRGEPEGQADEHAEFWRAFRTG